MPAAQNLHPCPNCLSTHTRNNYGGERGEAGPFWSCDDCGWDEEDELKAKASSTAPPSDNPMATIIQDLVDDVALAIEQKLGSLATIRAVGGPYVESLVIRQTTLLHEAAAAAIMTIVTHPKLRPTKGQ